MEFRLKLWISVSAFVLVGHAATIAAAPDLRISAALYCTTEGGEGGALMALAARHRSYRLRSHSAAELPAVAGRVVANYVQMAHSGYAEARREAEKLRETIDSFLRNPHEKSLALARKAWVTARAPYLRMEALRFYDGPIDAPPTSSGEGGPEPRLNAWPLNEAVIDYVSGATECGLVGQLDLKIDRASILANDQTRDEADVTTGWHAIEFLLWGQDQSKSGPGQRPVSDFLAGEQRPDRRRTYLRELSELLISDLSYLENAWDPRRDDGYAAAFKQLSTAEAIGRMLQGMAMLVGSEMRGERLTTALDSGSQEDEHSCFSDTTHLDFRHDLEGVDRLWRGESEQEMSLRTLVLQRNIAVAHRVDERIRATARAIARLPIPFDQMLLAPAESRQRKRAEQLVTELGELSEALMEAGLALGVLVSVPGVGASANAM